VNLTDKIAEAQKKWGKEFATDLKASLETALKKGRKGNPQEASLHFDEQIEYSSDGVKVQIIASGDYWLNIEKGRKPGAKRPPSEVVGKKWQNANNINAKKVLAEIAVNYKRKNGLSVTDRKITRRKKELSYDEAAKRLSFILAGSISKKGIKAKPYVQEVLNDGRVDELKQTISGIVGREIVLELNFKNEFENITIVV